VPPEEMAVAGVKAIVMDTGVLPTMRSAKAMLKETEETRDKMLPDDSVFDIGHAFARNATPTEPVVGGPIVKPLTVMVNAEAGMTAPDVVITTAVAEVAPHDAVKAVTLLAPRATEGTTEDAKKLKGYERVKVLPEKTDADGENTRVTETGDFSATRSIEEMTKDEKEMPEQGVIFNFTIQRDWAVNEEADTGVNRFNVVPSPTCTKNNSSPRNTSPPATNISQSKTKQTQASLGHCRCIPSMKLCRRSIPNNNDAANKLIKSVCR
jgi:hypothetical protein